MTDLWSLGKSIGRTVGSQISKNIYGNKNNDILSNCNEKEIAFMALKELNAYLI